MCAQKSWFDFFWFSLFFSLSICALLSPSDASVSFSSSKRQITFAHRRGFRPLESISSRAFQINYVNFQETARAFAVWKRTSVTDTLCCSLLCCIDRYPRWRRQKRKEMKGVETSFFLLKIIIKPTSSKEGMSCLVEGYDGSKGQR